MCRDNVHPIRVVWTDKNGEKNVGSGGLRKLLAQDPALGLAVLRGLTDWDLTHVLPVVGPIKALED